MKTILLTIYTIFLVKMSWLALDSTPDVPKRVYTTKSLGENKPPIVDGLLDDASWNIVEWTGDYIENQPDENTLPSCSFNWSWVPANKQALPAQIPTLCF